MEDKKLNDVLPQDEKLEFEEDTPKQQSPKANAYYANKRREAEGKKTYNDGVRETLKVNPYTEEEMKDDYDLMVYQEMRRLENEGQDPLKGIAKMYSKYRRDEEEKVKSEASSKAKIEEDFKVFKAEFPNVDLASLNNDSDFKDYAEGKRGNKSVSEIYKGYLALTKKAKKVEEKKEPMPSSISQGAPQSKSLKDMNDEEIHKLFAKKYPKNF